MNKACDGVNIFCSLSQHTHTRYSLLFSLFALFSFFSRLFLFSLSSHYSLSCARALSLRLSFSLLFSFLFPFSRAGLQLYNITEHGSASIVQSAGEFPGNWHQETSDLATFGKNVQVSGIF